MANPTVSQVKAEISQRCRDANNILVNDVSPNYLLTQLLHDACQQFSVDTKILRFQALFNLPDGTGECSVLLDAGTGSILTGASVIEIENVEWDYDASGGGRFIPVQPTPYRQLAILSQGGYNKAANPTWYAVDLRTTEGAGGATPPVTMTPTKYYLYLYPRPTKESPTKPRLRVTGIRAHSEINNSTSSSSVLEFPAPLVEGVIRRAEIIYLERDGREEVAAQRRGEYKDWIGRALSGRDPNANGQSRVGSASHFVSGYFNAGY